MTIFAMVKVGSRYEQRQINGASHFIEHLMFKGTKKRPSTELLSRTLDRYGAEYNAYTAKDLTAYYIKMDAAQTPLAIDMLHDMLFHSLYDAKEIDRERGVIIEEINMYEDNPRMHLGDLLEEVLFPDSTLGWNIAGPRDVIRAITRDQLIAYRDAHYIPERMTIVVAGKIIPGAFAMIQKTFGRISPSIKHSDVFFEPFVLPKKTSRPPALQNKKTEQVQLAMAFYGLPLDSDQLPAVGLLSTILGGSMSSRLFIELRERRGLCYSISCSHDAMEDVGAFTITAGLDKKRLHEAIPELITQLKKISSAGVSTEELRRAKDHLRGRLMLSFEDSASQAEWYGRQWTFLKNIETPEQKLRRYERVKAAEVQKMAAMIFRPEKMAVACIGPIASQKQLQGMLRW